MARPKKSDVQEKEKAKEPELPKESALLHIPVDEFIRSRDSVVTSLATLQSAVQDISRAYINHTNGLLGRPVMGNPLEIFSLSANAVTNAATSLLANPAATPAAENGVLAQRSATPGGLDDPDSKKRKRKPHDPNAPKRPLTPYFLFMHHARKNITKDLGESAKPGDISAEGTRQWSAMSEEQKDLWKAYYKRNLALYQEQVNAYKETGAFEPTDDRLAETSAEHKSAMTTTSAADNAEPAAKTPESKRRKTTKAAAASKASADASASKPSAPLPAAASDAPTPSEAKKKRSRKSKGGDEAEKEVETPAKADGDDKQKRSRRKRKSEATEA
ncbi:MAG: hypothetical protein M1819_000673 [Sarea resinae]|nr:MAG: hypothetical protein M1819_000673 [Sarea resinae]